MLCRVTATIKPVRLDAVVEALNDVGIHEFAVTEVHGFSRHGEQRTYRGVEHYAVATRQLVDVVVPANVADMVAELIATNASTGSADDGTVFISPVDRMIRMTTGEHDIGALE